MPEPIRYAIECRFCARHIGGDSAEAAISSIRDHDATHASCEGHGVRMVNSRCEVCDDDERERCFRESEQAESDKWADYYGGLR